jgi:RecB family exonuclease
VLRINVEKRSPYLSRGVAMHAAIQWMNEQRMHESFPSFSDVRAALHRAWSSRGFECDAQERQMRERSEATRRRFYDWERQQDREIIEVERAFEIPIEEHTLRGRIDCVARRPDGTIEILDYKSGKRSTKAEASNQLAIYHLAWTHEHPDDDPQTSLIFLGHDKDRSTALLPQYEPTRQTWTIGHTADSVQAARDGILMTASSILRNEFNTTSNARACRSCGYRHVCDGANTDV